MADQDAYSAAMREAADAAWDHDWERAIGSYKRAAELVQDDSQALAGLALSLMEAGYSDKALTAYERVSQLVPRDPTPHEKMAVIYSDMGRKSDAAKKYVAVAEIFFARQDLNRAVPYWQAAIDLDAYLPQPHMQLAVVYERNKETVPAAVAEYLEL